MRLKQQPIGMPSLMIALATHYDDLVSYIRMRFGGKGFAHDVIHDVCLELMERPPAQHIHTPLAFLRRASLHRAIDLSRRENVRQRWVDYVDQVPESVDHHGDAAWALEFKQQVLALIDVIENLPARPRQIFLLHRVHGMPQEEIAHELDMSRHMVAQHQARAMKIIRSRWAPAARRASRA